MARLPKKGLEYFALDTNRYQDRKIKQLRRTFGGNGVAVYDYVLTEIYRVEGCFLEWDANTAFDVADYWGIKESLANEIIRYCCSVGLFNKELLASEGILTSKAIQNRYISACKAMKRTDVNLPTQYILNTEEENNQKKPVIPPEETPKIPEEMGFSPEEIPQTKLKETKLNDEVEGILPEEIKTASPPPSSFQDSLPADDWRAIKTPEEHAVEAMNDINFLSVAWQTGVKDKPVVKAWLGKFNEFLYMQGKTAKNRADYRTHFLNWMKKKPYPERNQLPADENQKQQQVTTGNGPLKVADPAAVAAKYARTA